jgi:hypothetical protein
LRSIHPQTAEKNALKVIWGQTNGQTDRLSDQRTNIVSYRGDCMRLKNMEKIMKKKDFPKEDDWN